MVLKIYVALCKKGSMYKIATHKLKLPVQFTQNWFYFNFTAHSILESKISLYTLKRLQNSNLPYNIFCFRFEAVLHFI